MSLTEVSLFRAGLRQVPFDTSFDSCLNEARLVIFDVAERALTAAAVTPRDVRCAFMVRPESHLRQRRA